MLDLESEDVSESDREEAELLDGLVEDGGSTGGERRRCRRQFSHRTGGRAAGPNLDRINCRYAADIMNLD